MRASIATLVVLMATAASEGWAQAPRSAAEQQDPVLLGQAANSTAAPTAAARTEILTYDNWTVTCRDGRDPKEKRVCSAELDIAQEANNSRRVVFAWIVALNKEGVPTTVLNFLPGVMIAPGVELKFADKAPRKIPITSCEPTHCEATISMDEAFARDASAVVQAEAVVQASDGHQVTFTINMKGFASALAIVRK
jgi:invasion protein IalB